MYEIPEDPIFIAQSIMEKMEGLNNLSDTQQLEHVLSEFVDEGDTQNNKKAISEKIQKISIAGVRSFGTEQILEPSERLTIVYADNATGKTSFVDALELYSKGKTSRAENSHVSDQEVRDERTIPHSGPTENMEPITPTVTIEATSKNSSSTTCSTWKNTFGHPAQNSIPIEIIARRTLRDSIDKKAPERTVALAPALGMFRFDDFLRGLGEGLKSKSKETTIGPSPLAQFALTNIGKQTSEETYLKEISRYCDQVNRNRNSTRNQLRSTPSINPSIRGQIESLKENKVELESLKAGISPSDSTIAELYITIRPHMKEGKICPACHTATISSDRLEEIDNYITNNQAANKYAAKLSSFKYQYGELIHSLDSQDISWSPLAEFSGTPDEDYAKLHGLELEWRRMAEIIRTVPSEPDLAFDLQIIQRSLAKLDSISDEARSLILANQKELTDTEELSLALSSSRADIAQELARRDAEQLTVDSAKTLLKYVKDLHVTMVELALKELVSPINEWLDILSPDGPNKPRLEWVPRRTTGRTSTDIFVKGRDGVHAVGHLSDSQLDMLGLATHFARIERDVPNAMVVIDDPSDMLDTYTTDKLARRGIPRILDSDPSSGYARQVIVLTHDDDLIRKLWDANRLSVPLTKQVSLISEPTSSGDVEATFHSRSANELATEALRFIHDNENYKHSIWLRSHSAVQARRCLELLAQEICIILGPKGLSFFSESDSPDFAKLKETRAKIVEFVEDVESNVAKCIEQRHVHQRKDLDELLDLFAGPVASRLNPGAHADVILPMVEECKNCLESVKYMSTWCKFPKSDSSAGDTKLGKLFLMANSCPSCRSS